MAKSVIVVSGFVDTTLREYQKDVNFYIFSTLEDLGEFIERTPIRAETLYFTKDTLPLVNTSLSYLVTLLQRVFLKVDRIIYITENGSEEIDSVKFLIKQNNLDNWEIIQGTLNREYVTSVVNGTSRSELNSAKRKAVYRVPKDTYIRERSKQSEFMNSERYIDDDESIDEMPDEKLPIYIPPDRETACVCYDIIGKDIDERTLFVFILSQYLSTHGKTLILERDWEFHRLGEYVTKSEIECGVFYIEDLLSDALDTIDKIQRSTFKLNVVMCKRKIEYSYTFIFNLLYNKLISKFEYMIREGTFGEEPTEGKCTVVFPNTIPGVLSMCRDVNTNFLKYTKFVAIHMDTIKEIRIPTGEAIEGIIEDCLSTELAGCVDMVSLSSLTMGTDSTYDLRSVLWV